MQTVTELEVYQPGELTVIGFGGREILDHLNIDDCRDEIADLIREHDCKTLAFDLTGVRLISSDLLGIIASTQCRGVEVHLFNPSDDIREVLEITKLDKFLFVHEIDV
jgi:anti-sigma B factor antagonist